MHATICAFNVPGDQQLIPNLKPRIKLVNLNFVCLKLHLCAKAHILTLLTDQQKAKRTKCGMPSVDTIFTGSSLSHECQIAKRLRALKAFVGIVASDGVLLMSITADFLAAARAPSLADSHHFELNPSNLLGESPQCKKN